MNTFKISNRLFRSASSRLTHLPFQKKPLFSSFQRCFAQSASWSGGRGKEEAYNPYSAIITRSDSNIAVSDEWDEGKGVEDRFKLSKIHDVKKVFQILRQGHYKYPLNDMVHFLRRIVEINDEKHLNLSTENSLDLYSFVNQIKENLRMARQDYPMIGSYAWCFWKLNHQADEELWLTLADHIIDGRFHPNFNESMCGIEGFTALEGIADKSFIDEVYKKLERVLVLTIIEVNITHYRRIAESLIKVNRFTKYVFENIESHLMHFIATHTLQYDLKLMLDILAAFAIGGNGSEHLYYSFEQIFINYYGLEPKEQEELKHGDFISKLVQSYALAKSMHPDLTYDENFKRLVYTLVIGNEAHYNLEQLVNVMQHICMFEFPQIDEINKLLDKRLFEVQGKMNGDDIIRYIDYKAGRDYDGEYSQLPKEITAFFDNHLNKNMEKQDPKQLYNYIMEMEERGLMSGKDDFLHHLVTYVNKRLHIYNFEDMCYFFWLFNKYSHLIKIDCSEKQRELSQIKDHIRLYSAFSKGKLIIGSNFYKMLEVVSGSDFLSEGEYPEW